MTDLSAFSRQRIRCRIVMWQMVRGCGGNVPNCPKFWDVGASRNATQVMGRNYRRIVESGETGEGERPGAHVAIAISARLFIYQVNSGANLFLFALCFPRITMSTPRTFPHLGYPFTSVFSMWRLKVLLAEDDEGARILYC